MHDNKRNNKEIIFVFALSDESQRLSLLRFSAKLLLKQIGKTRKGYESVKKTTQIRESSKAFRQSSKVFGCDKEKLPFKLQPTFCLP